MNHNTEQPLFNDAIVAWQHGPVVESVYHQYKKNGAEGIPFDLEDLTRYPWIYWMENRR